VLGGGSSILLLLVGVLHELPVVLLDQFDDSWSTAGVAKKSMGDEGGAHLMKSASSELEALMGGAAGLALLPPVAR